MDLYQKITLILIGGATVLQFLFSEIEIVYRVQIIIILAIVLLWVLIDDTRKNYQKKRGRKNED